MLGQIIDRVSSVGEPLAFFADRGDLCMPSNHSGKAGGFVRCHKVALRLQSATITIAIASTMRLSYRLRVAMKRPRANPSEPGQWVCAPDQSPGPPPRSL